MKTREQIYGQEAAGILRDVSMYRALTEMQLLKLYPHKESKIRNLLSYLQKQGRIVQRGEYYRIPADAEESIDHGLSKAVWVLTDFMEQVEYHSVSEYPAKIIFFADGEVYEIIYAEPGKEQLINQMLSTVKEVPPKYIVLIEQPEQIAEIHIPNTSGYCTEICLPEIEIDGTTVFVLSHKGAIVCADATVPITAAFSAADTGTEYVVNNRTAVNANITIFFFTINKILLVHYWGTTHITHKEAKRDKFFELFSCNTSSNFYQFIRINGTVYGNEIAIPVTTNIIQISLFEVIACNFILIKWSNFCVFSIEINFGI